MGKWNFSQFFTKRNKVPRDGDQIVHLRLLLFVGRIVIRMTSCNLVRQQQIMWMRKTNVDIFDTACTKAVHSIFRRIQQGIDQLSADRIDRIAVNDTRNQE